MAHKRLYGQGVFESSQQRKRPTEVCWLFWPLRLITSDMLCFRRVLYLHCMGPLTKYQATIYRSLDHTAGVSVGPIR